MSQSQENFQTDEGRTERWKDGRTNRETLFYRTLSATARDPKIVQTANNLTGNKIANKITNNSLLNNSETDSQTEEKLIEIP